MGKGDILKRENQNSGNYTAVEDYLIMKRVRVNIQGGYHTPLDSVAEMFGHKGPFMVDTAATSAVVDAPDFVRNIDIVLDVASQSNVFGSIQKGYENIKKAIQKVTDLLK